MNAEECFRQENSMSRDQQYQLQVVGELGARTQVPHLPVIDALRQPGQCAPEGTCQCTFTT